MKYNNVHSSTNSLFPTSCLYLLLLLWLLLPLLPSLPPLFYMPLSPLSAAHKCMGLDPVTEI